MTKARPRRADSTGEPSLVTQRVQEQQPARRYPGGQEGRVKQRQVGQVRTVEAAQVQSSRVGHIAQGANQRTGRWATDSNRANEPEGDGLEPCRRASGGNGPNMNEDRVQRTQAEGTPSKLTAAMNKQGTDNLKDQN